MSRGARRVSQSRGGFGAGGGTMWMNQGAFLMRGLDDVRGEFSLTRTYNLRRALNILGVAAMIFGVRR